MNKPKFSVVMPVHNGDRFLKEAIDSILNQTFTNFEFIIIDDGSTDKSAEIINSYTDQRIRYYKNKENLGISKSLNVGIGLAEADYIARMDSDDICYTDRLQKQYDFISAHPDGSFYTCYAQEVTEDRKIIALSRFNPQHYFHSITFSCWIYHPTMVYRKDAVESIGKYTVPYSEDFELAWQLTRKFKHYHLPEVLLDYRVNSESLWQVTKKDEYKRSFLEQVRRNVKYYIGENTKITLEDWKLELVSYYYDSLREFSVNQIKECFDLLDLVTSKMIKMDNPNTDVTAILDANKDKKENLLKSCLSTFPFYKACLLLVVAGYPQRIPGFISGKVFSVVRRHRYYSFLKS